MRGWAVGGSVVLGVLFVVLVYGALVFVSSIGEGGPDPEPPDLPSGMERGPIERFCGSGGCGIQFKISSAEGESAKQILKRLPSSDCEANGFFDRRSRCTSYDNRRGDVYGSVFVNDW